MAIGHTPAAPTRDILADVPSYHERWTIAEIIKNNAQEGDVSLTPNVHNIEQLADAIRLNVSISARGSPPPPGGGQTSGLLFLAERQGELPCLWQAHKSKQE